MTADEINEGLAKYLWPDATRITVDSDLMFVQCPPTRGAIGQTLFTDSIDACEWVADKLGVGSVEIYLNGLGGFASRVLIHKWYYGEAGPTRAHALAAALYAAVQKGATE